MKDRQTHSQGAQASIPILSPILHWLAMPAIVVLRSGFGFSFLSPKSVFLAFSWASLLFLIYAWLEPGAWSTNWALAMFTVGSSALYLLHLLIAFARETQRKGKHDFYSGTSHLLRVPGFNQFRGNASFETILHLWVEPAAVFVAATALRGFMGEQRLSSWLVFVMAGLWLKEFINYWYGLRTAKKHEDIMEDAQEKIGGGGGLPDAPLPSASGRKPRAKRPVPASQEELDPLNIQEQQFAELLRLMPPQPPYDLQQAERNYRELIKLSHPDHNTESLANRQKTEALNEAIEFFRGREG